MFPLLNTDKGERKREGRAFFGGMQQNPHPIEFSESPLKILGRVVDY